MLLCFIKAMAEGKLCHNTVLDRSWSDTQSIMRYCALATTVLKSQSVTKHCAWP